MLCGISSFVCLDEDGFDGVFDGSAGGTFGSSTVLFGLCVLSQSPLDTRVLLLFFPYTNPISPPPRLAVSLISLILFILFLFSIWLCLFLFLKSRLMTLFTSGSLCTIIHTYIHTSLHLYLSPLSLSSLHLFFPHFKKLDLVFVLRGMFRLHLTFFFSLFVSSLNSRRLVMITTTWTGFLPFYSLFLQVLSSSLDSIASFLVSFPLSCLYPHLIPLHLQLTLQVTNLHIILRGRHTDSYPHFFLSPYTYIYAHIYNSYIAAYSPPPPPLPFSRYITTGSRQILFLARLRLSTL